MPFSFIALVTVTTEFFLCAPCTITSAPSPSRNSCENRLNLTHASRAYMLEPSWNPSVENQAVDRCHRLGQLRPVKVTKYIVRDTIEANMLEIQKRKTEL